MATLEKYFAKGTHSGSKEHVKAKVVGSFLDVGNGIVANFEPFKILFNGDIKIVIYNGPIDISMELTDHNEKATSGPCSVSITIHPESKTKKKIIKSTKADYNVNESRLTLACEFGKIKEKMTINQISEGKATEFKLSGKIKEEIHLVPVK